MFSRKNEHISFNDLKNALSEHILKLCFILHSAKIYSDRYSVYMLQKYLFTLHLTRYFSIDTCVFHIL